MTSKLWIYGPIANDDGATMWPAGGERHTRIEVCRADDGYRDEQPCRIPVRINHAGPTIGDVVHLEHRHRQLFAVAEIDFDRIDVAMLPGDGGRVDWYWSSGTNHSPLCDPYHIVDSVIRELSLTTGPAVVALRPVRSTRERPDAASSNRMLRRAAATISERRLRCDMPLTVLRLDDLERPITTRHPTNHRSERPVYRPAPQRGPDGMLRYISGHVGRVISVTP